LDNEKFQNLVINQLKELNNGQENLRIRIDSMDKRLDSMDERFDSIDKRLDSMDERFDSIDKRLDSMDERFDFMDKRQEEIYQVVRAIEHSNKVGKVERDNNNIRISKVEGKFKKMAQILNE